MPPRPACRDWLFKVFVATATLGVAIYMPLLLLAYKTYPFFLAICAMAGYSPIVVRAVFERRSQEMKKKQRLGLQYPSAFIGPWLYASIICTESVALGYASGNWRPWSAVWWVVSAFALATAAAIMMWRGQRNVYPKSAMESPSMRWFSSVSTLPPIFTIILGIPTFWHISWSDHGSKVVPIIIMVAGYVIIFAWTVTVGDRRRDTKSADGKDVINPAHGSYDPETGESSPLYLDPVAKLAGKVKWVVR